MASAEEHHHVPVDEWNLQEQHYLVSVVARTGDQNWELISSWIRAEHVKAQLFAEGDSLEISYAEQHRPSDFFSPISCAIQYEYLVNIHKNELERPNLSNAAKAALLLQIIGEKRKKELRKKRADSKEKYQKLQVKMKLIHSGKVSKQIEDQLCAEVEEELKQREHEKIAYRKWLEERKDLKKIEEQLWLERQEKKLLNEPEMEEKTIDQKPKKKMQKKRARHRFNDKKKTSVTEEKLIEQTLGNQSTSYQETENQENVSMESPILHSKLTECKIVLVPIETSTSALSPTNTDTDQESALTENVHPSNMDTAEISTVTVADNIFEPSSIDASTSVSSSSSPKGQEQALTENINDDKCDTEKSAGTVDDKDISVSSKSSSVDTNTNVSFSSSSVHTFTDQEPALTENIQSLNMDKCATEKSAVIVGDKDILVPSKSGSVDTDTNVSLSSSSVHTFTGEESTLPENIQSSNADKCATEKSTVIVEEEVISLSSESGLLDTNVSLSSNSVSTLRGQEPASNENIQSLKMDKSATEKAAVKVSDTSSSVPLTPSSANTLPTRESSLTELVELLDKSSYYDSTSTNSSSSDDGSLTEILKKLNLSENDSQDRVESADQDAEETNADIPETRQELDNDIDLEKNDNFETNETMTANVDPGTDAIVAENSIVEENISLGTDSENENGDEIVARNVEENIDDVNNNDLTNEIDEQLEENEISAELLDTQPEELIEIKLNFKKEIIERGSFEITEIVVKDKDKLKQEWIKNKQNNDSANESGANEERSQSGLDTDLEIISIYNEDLGNDSSTSSETDDEREKNIELLIKAEIIRKDEEVSQEIVELEKVVRAMKIDGGKSEETKKVSVKASTSSSDNALYLSWKRTVLLVHNRISNHRYAHLFLKPITEEQCPGYSAVIYRPMDLQTIKRKIENGIIRTTTHFKRDLLLMFSNAFMYNKRGSTVYNMTREMKDYALKEFDILREVLEEGEMSDYPETRNTDKKTTNKGKK